MITNAPTAPSHQEHFWALSLNRFLRVYLKGFLKPVYHYPIVKSWMVWDECNLMQIPVCLYSSQFQPIFHSPCPTDHIPFKNLPHNAFHTVMKIENRIQSIWSSLSYQTTSVSIRFFKKSHRIIRLCALTDQFTIRFFSIRSIKLLTNQVRGCQLNAIPV